MAFQIISLVRCTVSIYYQRWYDEINPKIHRLYLHDRRQHSVYGSFLRPEEEIHCRQNHNCGFALECVGRMLAKIIHKIEIHGFNRQINIIVGCLHEILLKKRKQLPHDWWHWTWWYIQYGSCFCVCVCVMPSSRPECLSVSFVIEIHGSGFCHTLYGIIDEIYLCERVSNLWYFIWNSFVHN